MLVSMSSRSEMTRVWSTGLVVLVLLAAGCGGSQSASETAAVQQPERVRFGTLSRSGLDRQSVDINNDGRPDQFNYSRAGRVVFSERDLDFDGNLDLYEYFDASGALIEQEFQLDFDEAIDMVRYLVNGEVVRKELATGFDRRFSITKFYGAGGRLLRVERDSDDDGVVDLWEYYDQDRVVRVGRDLDGDGIPEAFQSVD